MKKKNRKVGMWLWLHHFMISHFPASCVACTGSPGNLVWHHKETANMFAANNTIKASANLEPLRVFPVIAASLLSQLVFENARTVKCITCLCFVPVWVEVRHMQKGIREHEILHNMTWCSMWAGHSPVSTGVWCVLDDSVLYDLCPMPLTLSTSGAVRLICSEVES